MTPYHHRYSKFQYEFAILIFRRMHAPLELRSCSPGFQFLECSSTLARALQYEAKPPLGLRVGRWAQEKTQSEEMSCRLVSAGMSDRRGRKLEMQSGAVGARVGDCGVAKETCSTMKAPIF